MYIFYFSYQWCLGHHLQVFSFALQQSEISLPIIFNQKLLLILKNQVRKKYKLVSEFLKSHGETSNQVKTQSILASCFHEWLEFIPFLD